MAAFTRSPYRRALSVVLHALALSAVACLPDAEYKHDGPTRPEPLDDGWDIATPQEVGLDPDVLESVHAELLRPDRNFGTLGVLVVKDGKLVWETYLNSLDDRDHVHHLQSVTKSITSLAFGIARDDGLFPDLEATLYDFIPAALRGLDSRKRAITLEQLLTMRSGLDFENDVFAVEMWVDKPADPLRYMLEKPLFANPGERYHYRDVDPQLVTYLIEQETGQRERELVRERLFQPLGIDDVYWESGAVDGVTLGAHGLHLRPRDLAKIGQLLLDGCSWHGEQIVSAQWCTLATTQHVPPRETEHDDEPPLGYGYYYWTLSEQGAFSGWGHGGQFVLVVPSERLVLVQVARPDSQDLHGGTLEDFYELMSPLWQSQ